ncbi:microtubule-associated protein RP/EB family member 1-like [Teleopsis dalmanni]|uniref:microtubule-associated protein RP/EB family member 1-like n=1 Tax=Teleopsis dalmanni TaxID=139649 RepID=UPI0018CCF66E|nr:microtubule-associated protein RP/EB family member 1-like [Teleopsis dalmanni]
MRKAVNVCVCNNSENCSRFELLGWLNNTLCTNLQKIEQLSNGAAYCQLFDMLFPGVLHLNKVKFGTNIEYQYYKNFSLLQNGFKKVKVSRDIPINELVKARFLANFNFLLWFKVFFKANSTEYTVLDYDPIMRRNRCSIIAETPTKHKKTRRSRSASVSATASRLTIEGLNIKSSDLIDMDKKSSNVHVVNKISSSAPAVNKKYSKIKIDVDKKSSHILDVTKFSSQTKMLQSFSSQTKSLFHFAK